MNTGFSAGNNVGIRASRGELLLTSSCCTNTSAGSSRGRSSAVLPVPHGHLRVRPGVLFGARPREQRGAERGDRRRHRRQGRCRTVLFDHLFFAYLRFVEPQIAAVGTGDVADILQALTYGRNTNRHGSEWCATR